MKNNDKGFTLVELVVTFVILLIMLSISLVGVLAYQDYADYKRENSYAQALFSAAQAKLTDYSVKGEMERLEDIPKTPVNQKEIITPSGLSADQSPSGTEAKAGTVYCLTGSKEAYQKYLAGDYNNQLDEESRAYKALYDIFDEYLMDKSILNAAISLEFNPEKALVYSVLYSDKNGTFTYTAKNRDGRVNICNRQEDYRSEYLIGYFGLD